MITLILVDRVLDLVKKIIKKKEPKTENIHLIGFSLGSHIMGRIGRKLKDAGKEVGRITGATASRKSFPLRISFKNATPELFLFTNDILNGKLYL